MVILFLEHVPTSLRGELSRWMMEPRAGVFIGTLSAMVRDKLWDHLREKVPDCGALLIYNAKTEQGFQIRTFGDTTRKVTEFDGLQLIKRLEKKRPPPE
ncbi:MAG: type I-E CRISPR-associated endoribonuclease Cas2e [Armatimonadota bacterium]